MMRFGLDDLICMRLPQKIWIHVVLWIQADLLRRPSYSALVYLLGTFLKSNFAVPESKLEQWRHLILAQSNNDTILIWVTLSNMSGKCKQKNPVSPGVIQLQKIWFWLTLPLGHCLLMKRHVCRHTTRNSWSSRMYHTVSSRNSWSCTVKKWMPNSLDPSSSGMRSSAFGRRDPSLPLMIMEDTFFIILLPISCSVMMCTTSVTIRWLHQRSVWRDLSIRNGGWRSSCSVFFRWSISGNSSTTWRNNVRTRRLKRKSPALRWWP